MTTGTLTTETKAKEPPSLLVVIVNYRTPDLSIACLRSLAQEAKTLPKHNYAIRG